jgi:mono/diheme cytochrome c family protein
MNGRMKNESLDDVGGDSLKPILLIMATLMTFLACASTPRADDVARQARHLLAQKCFVCHGPDRNSEDAKETDLRLDLREVALKHEAIVPGDAAASELMTRVTSRDSDSQMPPPGHGEPLSKDEVEVLRRWIATGANYESHRCVRAETARR